MMLAYLHFGQSLSSHSHTGIILIFSMQLPYDNVCLTILYNKVWRVQEIPFVHELMNMAQNLNMHITGLLSSAVFETNFLRALSVNAVFCFISELFKTEINSSLCMPEI